jgi:hypothetical protein
MKFIIWGHKLHESTHGYIHNSFKKTLDFLGYETYWIDHRDDISSIDFSDAVFIVERSRSHGMPFLKNCKYIAMSFTDEDFEKNEIPKENIIHHRHHCDIIDPDTFEHKNVEKIEELSYWNDENRILYQAWATDLLPFEIDHENPIKFNKNSKYLNYIAMLSEETLWWATQFASHISDNHGSEFTVYTQNASDEENKKLIQESLICPDFRGDWHLRCGYIPCRIFKNISYGRICGTNSPWVKQYFRDYVVFGGTPKTLYENLLDAEINQKVNMKEAMIYVKENHTYVNRIQNIVKLFGEK